MRDRDDAHADQEGNYTSGAHNNTLILNARVLRGGMFEACRIWAGTGLPQLRQHEPPKLLRQIFKLLLILGLIINRKRLLNGSNRRTGVEAAEQQNFQFDESQQG